ADRRKVGKQREKSEERARLVAKRDGRQADGDRAVVDLHARHRRLLLERALERAGKCRKLDDVTQLAPGELLVMRQSEDVAAGGQASRESGGDAFEIVGAGLLAIVELLEFLFLRFQGGDGVAKSLDEIGRLFLIACALAELARISQHLLDRLGNPRQIKKEEH